ncbi:3'-phosphoadenosine 5'-phosphosulfate sulfotransferase [Mesorhizobium sp. M4A.F.Ca.ET.090.04.2.1]|uniref:3'-phosphoadenosine 5'-phosphosulfate sulfotransferase n=1 Tax=Mesorhizobium sp. M4A.F.Ca.ET.090.04.2.1 TaxID=2496663 RepID=UPI000FCA1A8D|nr:3'-phosphoadenosine 5'-phosphosulfate sulfotransferase [Mesorhizobium sp. M4A.F.Ca.ET.090.04.2.1]RVC47609.1 3'-phosphoadenosine 5'-phosphosulfate sulfotransferase [Mesorhizobium sp. M4A.F.Ca.ET.090.04.2.1]
MNPYLIEGPALISFSGGRTSAFMLHQIVHAHGGKLPDNVVVAFANTGKEREETLRFVHECGSRWGVEIYWIEWRNSGIGYERVGLNSASRDGEPFHELISKKQRLPNGAERWCTEYLKVRPIFALMRHLLGLEPGSYEEIVGLRYDEGMRIFRGLDRAAKDGRRMSYPLSRAKIRKSDVSAFWEHQPFFLDLEPWEGNCDLCFQKGKGIRKRIIRDHPGVQTWWLDEENRIGAQFDKRDSVADLVEQVRLTPMLWEALADSLDDSMEHDVECGLHCSGEAA